MNCNVKDCTNEARWELRLSLSVHPNHTPAISTPLMYVCEDHKHATTFEEITSYEGNWEKICIGFLRMGRMTPSKKYSKLIVMPINQTNIN